MSSKPYLAYPAPGKEQVTGGDPEILQVLSRFEVLKKLSDCGTQAVYLARDLARADDQNQPASLVRLTILSPHLAADPTQAYLFRLEAAAAAKLHHRNIIPSSEAEEAKGIHFCVAQVEPGTQTLREYLKLKGWLPVSEAVEIALQIADALQYAHGQDVLHITLDPEKVLLTPDGTVLVSGFGIERAKYLLWARHERSHRCSPTYISPEQILSGDVDRPSDLYQLGLLLYEMLTDRVPFEGEDVAALRLKHLTRPPQPPSVFRPELPKALSEIVLKLLGKRTNERPFGVRDVKAVLRQCLGPEAVADEEHEKVEGPATLVAAQPTVIIDDLADGATMSEAVTPSEPPVTAASVSLLDVPTNMTETEAPSLMAAEFQDVPSMPEYGYEEEVEPLSESFDEVTADLPADLYDLEVPVQKPTTYPLDSYLADRPTVPFWGFGNLTPSRLFWPVVLLLIAGLGLFWAIRVPSFEKETTRQETISKIAEPRSDAEAASPKSEASSPEPEPAVVTPVKELPPRPEPLSRAAEVGLASRQKEVAAARQPEAASERPVAPRPPKSLKIIPPDLSPLPVINLPGRSPGDGRNDLQAKETPSPSIRPTLTEAPAPTIIRKSGDVLQNTATVRPRPTYPQGARANNITGAVTVEVTIDEEGSVIAARPISGPEPLRNAAVSAARGWKWTPTKVERRRTKVVGTITFTFKD